MPTMRLNLSILSKINEEELIHLVETYIALFQFYPRSTGRGRNLNRLLTPCTFNSIQDQPRSGIAPGGTFAVAFQFYPRSTLIIRNHL